MKKLIPLLLALLLLDGCIWMWDPMFKQFYDSEVYKHNQSRDWICMADINRDSKCVKFPCERIGDICGGNSSGNKFRVLKSYYTKEVIIYSLDPSTNLEECKRNANAPPKMEP
jgi:hypothetical protein